MLTPRARAILWGILILALAATAYAPALRGDFVWDDDDYVTDNPTLTNLDGLRRIWLEFGATPQYYPLVYTTFWIEYHIWQLHPFGYHLTNVLLHMVNALLLWAILRRLAVPGAWLAAAIFAVHPVHVESVAWITERKNVLSGAFYLSSMLLYLRFAGIGPDRPSGRRRWAYFVLALLLFACALLSKSVTCTLPAALVLLLWWRRRRLRASDLWPLIGWLVVGLLMALTTVWMERHHVGTRYIDWSLSPLDRCLIAGRAVWFYAAKLLWPAKLTFFYPRWHIDAGLWWQYLFPLAAVAVIAALWWLRSRLGKGPLVAVLLFVGTLTPALGFVDVYPMRFSFVADHFQYLASAGLIALGAAFLWSIETRIKRRRAISAINELRDITHVIDMKQLTKDPDTAEILAKATTHSPERSLDPFGLWRYLDYCTEMLSLTSKLGYLYVENFHDTEVSNAATELENLCTGLSRKIWQKIMILRANSSAD